MEIIKATIQATIKSNILPEEPKGTIVEKNIRKESVSIEELNRIKMEQLAKEKELEEQKKKEDEEKEKNKRENKFLNKDRKGGK